MNIKDIAEVNGDCAEFNGFGSLKPDEAGKLLASFDGEIVIPAGDRLPDAFLESLVLHKGKSIRFIDSSGGMGQELSVRDAEILSSYQGRLIVDMPRLNYVRGHPRLHPPYSGGERGLLQEHESQDELSIAKAFSRHKGSALRFSNLYTISTAAAKELFKHETPVCIGREFHTEGQCGRNKEWIANELKQPPSNNPFYYPLGSYITEWEKIVMLYNDAEKRWFPNMPENEYPTNDPCSLDYL